MLVTEISLSKEGSDQEITFEFDQETSLEEVNDRVSESALETIWNSDESLPDTSDPEWKEPRFVNEGTIKAETLNAVCEYYPCTSPFIEEQISADSGASAYISKMRKDGLVAYVGSRDGRQVIVPTHIGLKEWYCLNGMPPVDENGEGLDALFKGEEQEQDNKEDKEKEAIENLGDVGEAEQ